MSISSSKSASSLSKSLYPKIGITARAANKPISSALFHSTSIPVALKSLQVSHPLVPAVSNGRMSKYAISRSHSNQKSCFPWPRGKRFYSRKLNVKPQPSSSKVFRELKKLHREIKGKSDKNGPGETFQTFVSKKCQDVKNMTPFEMSRKWLWIPVSGLAYHLLRSHFTDQVKKSLKVEINHISVPEETLSHKEVWVQTKNIDKLDGSFSSQQAIPQKLAITGIGGSGKTVLAKQYIEHYEQKMKGQQDKISTPFFGDMQDMESFFESYRKFAVELGVHVPLKAQKEVIISEVNKKLAQRPDWLFVIDNVDPKNYEELQAFLPQDSKGRILMVSREKLNKVKTFDMQVNHISEDEALEIFHLNLGSDHWALNQASNSKRDLALQLSYLPLALKQAALYLKAAKPSASFDSIVSTYTDKLRSLMGVSKETSMHLAETSQILKAVLLLSIEACEKQRSEAKELFTIIPFLNPYFIEESLLKLWGKSHLKSPKSLTSLLDELEGYGLIARKGAEAWEIHSSLQELLLEKMSKEGKKTEQVLKNFLGMLKDNYSLNMVSKDSHHQAKAIENQWRFLSKYATEHQLAHELKHCFVHVYNVLGNYYLQSNNFFEARQAFERSLELAGLKLEDKEAEEICRILKDHQELPALYSQTLHYLGIIHFHAREWEQAERYFNKAVDIQKEIAKNADVYKNPNPVDLLIFQRQGPGWLLIEGDKDDLLKAEKLYLDLFQEKRFAPPGKEQDVTNQRYCNLQLGRVYLKLAQAASKEDEAVMYYQKALGRLEKGGLEQGASFQGAIQMRESGHRKAGEAYLVLGELYLDKNCPFKDLEKAKNCFKKAVEVSETDLRICAKSSYYLTKLYWEKGRLDKAFKANTGSIDLYNQVGGKGLTKLPIPALREAEMIRDTLIADIKGAFRNDAALIG
ncbi:MULTISPECIES: NB-ARC domain-containing protein [unclassified Neochlamydia]|uniref:NB-ARC domain-containing protein n=1 Tax=unclassified Neochlamydia TaxID=2643326 RepID=UPI001BC93789|nr:MULTISPECIES: NB-ARC domain-containing protein [unclassified Neochlamydia]MBS4166041.1 Uncharacterized protein [Neochlamydia sp. AcF65]MBS4169587.1 Uncharacterized protein [Neochlamydia sp. AcF95]